MFRLWEMCLTAAVEAEESQQIKNTHVNLKWVMDYLEHRVYPASIPDKGSRANFRCCRPFTVKDGVLYYKKTMAKVIITPEERIKLVHDGADSSLEASALSWADRPIGKSGFSR
ncbi:Integrase catalytic domain-containing protein [Aphis craccivora]|uniref:Integrase catalytic domain-containing protein n=1 Tax=Aphis craccivora TaxID=307492 RepID=A0A6G0VK60_APHCR|nr:Integrase catalytic domain-containing protein [Aphis craccivora]